MSHLTSPAEVLVFVISWGAIGYLAVWLYRRSRLRAKEEP